MNTRPLYPSQPAIFCTFALAGLLGASMLAGCASTKVDAQWTDPGFSGTSLRGSRILVACEAADLALKQVCEDQVSAEVVARGATPVVVQELVATGADAYAPAARSTGAKAALVVQLTQADARSSGSGVSFGLGGFGIGGGHVGAGVGVSVPIGGGRTDIGYAANGRLTDAASGRLMWTARASAPPSSDLNAQLGELARAVLGGAGSAGFL